MRPIWAVVALLISVIFVGRMLWPSLGEQAGSGLANLIGFEEPPDMDGADPSEASAIDWQDLLAVHGSFDREAPVRLSFSVTDDAQSMAAAPAGETAANAGGGWTGEDPPLVRLGVVMVSAGSRRAVFGGSVVGVGDATGGGTVLGIEPGTIRLRWHDRQLTYDLSSEAPREFRAEYLRRQARQQAGDDATEGMPREEQR